MPTIFVDKIDGNEVEVFQVPPDDGHTRAWPQWFLDGVVSGHIVTEPNGGVLVGSEVARVGDWLVLEKDVIRCYSTEHFAATYIPKED